MKCKHCAEDLKFDKETGGYVHSGGSAYVVKCESCGYQCSDRPTPFRCPRCNSSRLLDDHCALPDMSSDAYRRGEWKIFS